MFTIQIDQKISLAFPEKSAAQPLFDVVEHDRVALGEWLPWVAQTLSVSDEENYLKQSAEKMLAGTLWLAVILVDGHPVGAIDIHNIALDKTHGEIGYWIAERVQGQGIMTRALEKVVAIGFQELGLHRLNLLTDVDNQKSQRVAQKLALFKRLD